MSLVDVNDGACRMLGFSREALLRIDPVALGLATAAQLERHLADQRARPHEADIAETATAARRRRRRGAGRDQLAVAGRRAPASC